jgi:6-pyruvoyltetrahydropterin/6-carboxytetrahydropterin synthase
MYEITVETHFFATHQLVLPDGSKEPVHEHDWLATAYVGSEKLNNIGIVMDFRKLRKMLENITMQLDKKNLNTLDYFRKNNTSAENIAKFIFDRLEPQLPENVELTCVSVVEEPHCRAIFRR